MIRVPFRVGDYLAFSQFYSCGLQFLDGLCLVLRQGSLAQLAKDRPVLRACMAVADEVVLGQLSLSLVPMSIIKWCNKMAFRSIIMNYVLIRACESGCVRVEYLLSLADVSDGKCERVPSEWDPAIVRVAGVVEQRQRGVRAATHTPKKNIINKRRNKIKHRYTLAFRNSYWYVLWVPRSSFVGTLYLWLMIIQ